MSKYLKLLNSDTSSINVGASLGEATVRVEIPACGYAVVQKVVGLAIQINNPSLEVTNASQEQYLEYRALEAKEKKDLKKAKELAKEKADEDAKEKAKASKERNKEKEKAEKKLAEKREKELELLKKAEEQVIKDQEAKKAAEELVKNKAMAESLIPVVKLALKQVLEEQKVDKKKSKSEDKKSSKSK